MSRYIDAETIKVSITRYGECVVKHKHLNFIKEMVKEIISDVCFAIDAQPTVDAVPVVRCRECKHRFVDGTQVRFNVCELNHNRVQSDDWYCADGEKAKE